MEDINKTIQKLKVTQVSRHAFPFCGGIEAVIKQISDSLTGDFEQEVITCSNKHKTEVFEDVKYSRCKYFFEIASNPISLKLIWELSKVKTDVLHYHMPYIFSVLAHFIARPKYKKLSITYHSDIVGYDNIMKLFNKAYQSFLNSVDEIYVLSPNIIENSPVLQKYKHKCIVTPYGVDLDSIEVNKPLIEKIKKQYEGKKILFSIGRLVPYKGFKYAIETMKQVAQDCVYLIGGSGVLKEELQNQIDENNLNDKVILLGRISDEELQAYYHACDIYLLPSIMQSEAFGIVQLEAMMCNKPVINTWLHTGVNYASIHNETGLSVEPKNPKQLEKAINLLLEDENLRLKMGKQARKRVDEVFNINKLKDKYRELFGSCSS